MNSDEKELLEGYRQLPQETKNFILSTVITATTTQDVILGKFKNIMPEVYEQREMPAETLQEAVA